jgi:formylmethanofuran dehydrogenase subunit E
MYCSNCWIDKFYECSQCWETKYMDDAKEDPDGEYCCRDCWNSYYVECENCEAIIYQEDAVEIDGQTLCPDCAADFAKEEI